MAHTDPVCGMTVEPATAAGAHDHAGTTYYFCSAHCLHKFRADPAKFLQTAETSAHTCCSAHSKNPSLQHSASSAYTCPMHPAIRQPGPGVCPQCGMDLERESPAVAGEPADAERDTMTRRFWVSLALTAPVFVIAMLHLHRLAWVQLALATPVVVWGGWPFFQRGWQSIVNRRLNMFTLIALGTGVGYAYSVSATLLPGIFPASFRSEHGEVAVYFEAAAVITTLVLLGQMLEHRARARTSTAIQSLLQLVPKTARIMRADGSEQDVDLSEIKPGDRLRVRPGETVPVDGVLVDGTSAIDESLVTGESMPVEKQPGDSVIGGTINILGGLVMEASHSAAAGLLARIVQIVREAQRSRAPIQRLADRVASWFVPAVIGVAGVTFLAWWVWGPEPRLAHALVNAVAVLIIACPCALGLATPMSIMVGTGRGATEGVLIRNAEALEIMEQVDRLVLDKTGTLTEGKPRLVSILADDENELLRLAASVERASEHPLAGAIVAGAGERHLSLASVTEFQATPGQGVAGRVDGRAVSISNRSPEKFREQADRLRRDGQTVVFVTVDGRPAGLLGVADPIKDSTAEALQLLRAEQIELVMVTGDNLTTAQAVADKLGLDRVEAAVLPERKSEVVAELQQAGHIVALAGDGVNDAPALARANVGIAMGHGTDIAMESAGITLVKGDLRGIAKARRLSRATMRNIRQNLLFAFLYNALGVPIAAGALYPFGGILLSPMIAAAAMSFSSVSVVLNALRLRKVKL